VVFKNSRFYDTSVKGAVTGSMLYISLTREATVQNLTEHFYRVTTKQFAAVKTVT
jgi:hypothetical protein